VWRPIGSRPILHVGGRNWRRTFVDRGLGGFDVNAARRGLSDE